MDAITFTFSKNKVGKTNESSNKKAITKSKLLIQDPGKFTIKGDLPTWLVIPATNLSYTFEEVGYLGLKLYWKKMI